MWSWWDISIPVEIPPPYKPVWQMAVLADGRQDFAEVEDTGGKDGIASLYLQKDFDNKE